MVGLGRTSQLTSVFEPKLKNQVDIAAIRTIWADNISRHEFHFIPAHNPDFFQYYVHWLYNKSLNGYHNCGLNAISHRTTNNRDLTRSLASTEGVLKPKKKGRLYLHQRMRNDQPIGMSHNRWLLLHASKYGLTLLAGGTGILPFYIIQRTNPKRIKRGCAF